MSDPTTELRDQITAAMCESLEVDPDHVLHLTEVAGMAYRELDAGTAGELMESLADAAIKALALREERVTPLGFQTPHFRRYVTDWEEARNG